ncbi:endonuclease/exonuclease/phosphatase family protein [Belnapia sp. T6]|uniref:Endonuclease/exonuclease/phosphatase family protein n=1 Tax=Belnapia mucosa TaxID=2804532 RepID=A0ABS1V3W1_9PROT|nr:endonuclease/exonuclease/phosphatase family protein [Belnapia mucosa]MBL6455018.1 endonuclease/exonuclease/phosphatase family protein [Belnapia mucosa]
MRITLSAFTLLLTLLLPPLAQARELKLASWNLAWFTGRDWLLPRDRAPRRAEDVARLAEYARRLDPDILALQEVDGPEAAARLLDARDYAFFFPEEDDVQRAGFAVRRSLRVTRNPDLAGLDLNPGARFSLRRGTDIMVEAEGRRLRLLSLHLKSGCSSGRLDRPEPECEQLVRQGEILAGWVAARQREGVAFALLGDFNRALGTPGDALWARLAAAAPLLRATEGVSSPCWAGPRGGRAFIDHILLGGAARDWAVPESLRVLVYAERSLDWRDRLSDHCPVSLRLRLH